MDIIYRPLALLNLATLGGDPIDNPTPWCWGRWMSIFGVDRAPWAGPRWNAKTRLTKPEWNLVRKFLFAFYDAGDNHVDRFKFAVTLPKGALNDGFYVLASKLEQDWKQAGVDRLVDTILESMGITTVHHLDVEVMVTHESIPNVADFLLGRAAFDNVNKPHGLVYDWVLEVLRMTLARKQCLHNKAVKDAEGIQRDVYIACKDVTVRTCGPQEIIAYLQSLTSLVKQLDLTCDNDRQRQHDYYRDHLYVIEVLMGGKGASSPLGMPPNLKQALLNMPSWPRELRTYAETALRACCHAVDNASKHVPNKNFDLYEILCEQTLGLVAGFRIDYADLGNYPEEQGEHSPAWDDDNRAAFLLAALTLPHTRK